MHVNVGYKYLIINMLKLSSSGKLYICERSFLEYAYFIS
jgi:hypothetical protein